MYFLLYINHCQYYYFCVDFLSFFIIKFVFFYLRKSETIHIALSFNKMMFILQKYKFYNLKCCHKVIEGLLLIKMTDLLFKVGQFIKRTYFPKANTYRDTKFKGCMCKTKKRKFITTYKQSIIFLSAS